MQILTVVLAMGLITACSNDQNADNQADDTANEPTMQQTSPQQQQQQQQMQQQQQQQMGDQTASSETVYHYTCPEGHAEGGSNQPGTCSVCGAKLTHNSAFHQQQQGQQGQPGAQTKQQLKQKLQQQQQQAEPKTNAEGEKVFHYACPEGHKKGGSMQPGTCSVCGAKLVHNNTYHQQ